MAKRKIPKQPNPPTSNPAPWSALSCQGMTKAMGGRGDMSSNMMKG